MSFFFQIALSGLATGAVYALIAVGYSLTYMTTQALNFALGMWVMLGGMITYTCYVTYDLPLVIVLIIVGTSLFALGLVSARISVHPFLKTSSDVWVLRDRKNAG